MYHADKPHTRLNTRATTSNDTYTAPVREPKSTALDKRLLLGPQPTRDHVCRPKASSYGDCPTPVTADSSEQQHQPLDAILQVHRIRQQDLDATCTTI